KSFRVGYVRGSTQASPSLRPERIALRRESGSVRTQTESRCLKVVALKSLLHCNRSWRHIVRENTLSGFFFRGLRLTPLGPISPRIRYNRKFMLRYFTAGESHGEALVAFLSGVPAGLKIDQAFLDRELWRRQQGYGRGGRMKIERDTAHILSGVRQGMTIGSPISIQLENKDWKNWQESLPVGEGDPARHKRVASPRPGHADLAGALKYNFPEARYVLERASARESAARVAIGALAKTFLRELGIDILSHVVAVGNVAMQQEVSWEQIQALYQQDEILLNCPDTEVQQRMKDEVDKIYKTGDSLGGVFEVVARGVPHGLGTYAQWDERLDGLLAGAIMSLQAVKAVEIGSGIAAAASPGSAVHDEIGYGEAAKFTGFTRARNNAGGIEGGISNGEEIRVRRYLKPISTLRRPLKSV